MNDKEFEEHVRQMADSRCKQKHEDYYDQLAREAFGPPCTKCLEKTRKELEAKRGKMVGRELSPEEAAKVRRELGLEE